MVGDFMVCVDRIIASAASLEPGNAACAGEDGGAATEGCSGTKKVGPRNKKAKKGRGAVECRICQEEGEEGDMETPCACNGTLKFAHRKCIQKWCNKKGNITCEICNQVFSPHYSVPLSRPSSDVLAIDIRQSWMTRIDIQDPHLLGITAAEQELLSAEYEDYAVANSSGVACCRTVALILMLLLLVRHILYAVREVGMAQDISVLFNASLQLAGFFLPCYVIARSCYFIQCRRRHLV